MTRKIIPIVLTLAVILVPQTMASTWTLTGYTPANYLNSNSSTTLDWSFLNCYDSQSTDVYVSISWGDGATTVARGVNAQNYLLSPSPIHTYSVYSPAQYTGSIYCLEDGGTAHQTFTFTVMIYAGYSGGIGGGTRPHPT